MAIIEVNIAGLKFTHGAPDPDPDAPTTGSRWQLSRLSVRPNRWPGTLLRRTRAA